MFAVIVILSMCFHVAALTNGFAEHLPISNRRSNEVNLLVRRDIDFFLSVLHVSTILLVSMHMILLERKRKAIASTFNDLNALWILYVTV